MRKRKSARYEYSEKMKRVKSDLLELMQIARNIVSHIFRSLTQEAKTLQELAAEDKIVRKKTAQLLDLATELLSLQQPMAVDLRVLLGAIRIKTDIERIARDSLHIIEIQPDNGSEKTTELTQSVLELAPILDDMFDILKTALMTWSAEKLPELSEKDDHVDRHYAQMREALPNLPELTARPEFLIDTMLAARMLERVADHLCNIGEKINYVITGEHVRIK